jgi:hypothetical protein
VLGTLPRTPTWGITWWALGVHGGAGVSTLLRTIGGGGDAHRRWPDIQGADSGVHVLLVARADFRGVTAAQAALQEWHSGLAPASTTIVGLALMADAPTKPPVSIRDRIRVLTGAVDQSWEVPWIEEWREGGKPPKRVKALAALEQTLQRLPPPQISPPLGATPVPTPQPHPAPGTGYPPSAAPPGYARHAPAAPAQPAPKPAPRQA